jgi:hypothetical protein
MAYRRILIRRDTAANWTANNPTLSAGEFGHETDTGKLKIGTGSTAWNSLPYQSGVTSINGQTGVVTGLAPTADPTFTGTVSGVTKGMVGLGNVDNTSDANKPVSTAQQTALDLKANLASPTFTGTPTLPTGTIATTQTAGNNTTALATTAFVTAAITTPKIYVAKFTTNGSGTWTCPAGVTQIKLTLIGAGGAGGNASAEAILPTATNYQSYASQTDTAGSTTFVVGGTSYTALGGKKGIDHNVSVTGDSHNGGFSNSTSSSSSQTEFRAENRYPGSGGGGFGVVSGLAWTFSVEYGADTWQHIIRARAEARSGRGQDGVTEVFQVTVVPLTVYSFTVGAGAGYAGTTSASMGSNGAVTIEYVI